MAGFPSWATADRQTTFYLLRTPDRTTYSGIQLLWTESCLIVSAPRPSRSWPKVRCPRLPGVRIALIQTIALPVIKPLKRR